MIVEFNARNDWTDSMIRNGIKDQALDAFETFYQSSVPIDSVKIIALLPLIDRYGNESDGVVFSATMDKETASKVNWDNKSYLDLEKIGVVSFIHPAIQ